MGRLTLARIGKDYEGVAAGCSMPPKCCTSVGSEADDSAEMPSDEFNPV